jgi:hypothetical protein
MRIRMIEPRRVSIDGVDLSMFQSGHAYEVDPSVATYLVVAGVAEPCSDDCPALVVHMSEAMVGVFANGAGAVAEVADDREDDE